MSFILSEGWKISAILKFSIKKNTRMYDARCPPYKQKTIKKIRKYMNWYKNRKLDDVHLPSHTYHFCPCFVVFSYQTMFVSFKSRMMGVTNRAGITYPSGAPQFTPWFLVGGSCCSIFGFLCIVLSTIVLSFSPFSFGHCITYIYSLWLPLQFFSYTTTNRL